VGDRRDGEVFQEDRAGLVAGQGRPRHPAQAASGDTYTTRTPAGSRSRTFAQASSRARAAAATGSPRRPVMAFRQAATASSTGSAGPSSTSATAPRVTTNAR
jgi:hypothetical protein